jgi:hypothetical protein
MVIDMVFARIEPDRVGWHNGPLSIESHTAVAQPHPRSPNDDMAMEIHRWAALDSLSSGTNDSNLKNDDELRL